jgi:hypothetical protein
MKLTKLNSFGERGDFILGYSTAALRERDVGGGASSAIKTE